MSLSSFNPNAPPFTTSFPSFSPFTPIPSPDLTTHKSRPGSHSHSRSSHSHSHFQSQNITPMPDLDESKSPSTPSTESPPLPTPGKDCRAAPWTGISGSTIAARLNAAQAVQSGQAGEYGRVGDVPVGRPEMERGERTTSYTWQSSVLGLGMGAAVAPPVHRSNTQAMTRRSAVSFPPPSRALLVPSADALQLGDLNLNLTTDASVITSPLGLASPFVPADPVWGPPAPLATAAASRQPTMEEVRSRWSDSLPLLVRHQLPVLAAFLLRCSIRLTRPQRLVQAEEKIRHLTLENQQLRSIPPPTPDLRTAPLSSYNVGLNFPATLTFPTTITPGMGNRVTWC